MTNATALRVSSPTWLNSLIVLVVLAPLSLLTTSCADRPQVFYTGEAYLRLEEGQVFVAPRKMTLATEAVIQDKDRQLLELIGALRKLQAELDLRGSP